MFPLCAAAAAVTATAVVTATARYRCCRRCHYCHRRHRNHLDAAAAIIAAAAVTAESDALPMFFAAIVTAEAVTIAAAATAEHYRREGNLADARAQPNTLTYLRKNLARGSPGGPPHFWPALVFVELQGHKALCSRVH